ncbi:MAG: hypothetical protein V4532_14805 [Pseudomonadota bacterium]
MSSSAITSSTGLLSSLNRFILNNIRSIEMIGVLMRICSFSLVSWFGPASPFLFVWAFNTLDAVILSWCAILKRDPAYSLLNVFWILVGVVGMLRASNLIGH